MKINILKQIIPFLFFIMALKSYSNFDIFFILKQDACTSCSYQSIKNYNDYIFKNIDKKVFVVISKKNEYLKKIFFIATIM